jgi:hypothetical protein
MTKSREYSDGIMTKVENTVLELLIRDILNFLLGIMLILLLAIYFMYGG